MWILLLLALAQAPVLALMSFGTPQRPTTMHQKAPELVGGPWVNTPGNKAISLAARKGKVTIVEFWTFE